MSDYITREALASEVGADDNRDQIKLDAARSAASRQVEHHCGRRFWQDDTLVERKFWPQSATCLDLLDQPGSQPKVEISTQVGLIVALDETGDQTFASTLTIGTDFFLAPVNAEADSVGISEVHALNRYFPIFTTGVPSVKITAKFGWAAVPDEVVRATMLQAIYLFKSKDAPLGIAQFGPDGAGMRLSNAPLHRAAAGLLAGLQRPPIG